MKRFAIILLCMASFGISWSQEVPFNELSRISQHLMQSHNPAALMRGTDALVTAENRPVGYVFRFAPTGFLIVSTSVLTRPVYGYSLTNDFDLSDMEWQIAEALFSADLQNRIQHANRLPEATKQIVRREWAAFRAGDLLVNPAQYWPPQGSTPSGGWVITNWTQSAPYNLMCPIDLNAGVHSLVGCPATAMGQILNYHETLNGTTFNDSDDYYHSYGSGNQYTIDDDHAARGFPSWDSLNTWLTSMEYAYQIQVPVTMDMIAALSFACGAAAHQVYTASVSGTFGIDQAWDSFQRFGFGESRLIYPTDTSFNREIAENMKLALPVQLGLLVAPPGSGGHNVVVDGYNTDEYYHFNFGWGGGSDGWYTLPPTSIAYNLTIIEGAVLDIKSANYTGNADLPQRAQIVTLFPNPVSSRLTVVLETGGAELTIFSLSGMPLVYYDLQDRVTGVSLSQLTSGLYIARVTKNGKQLFAGKLIKN